MVWVIGENWIPASRATLWVTACIYSLFHHLNVSFLLCQYHFLVIQVAPLLVIPVLDTGIQKFLN
ncbi:hypothetical protein HCR11_06160 [Wolbachia pipientis]|uniref:hypothetical protein n=1 Tax=Wolbachia TaxID=953 RepID=UPI00040158D1|nr:MULTISPECIES: hypothetical protein [Wolbachia]MBA8767406.1 hypothetical protein [Wolbachia pipientis]RLT61555.1 putative membrane protein [Wolbachia endosymbiont of Drosophila ananassae]RLT61917.1 putative membrane protein [Wolbachia endosymbiont of Drosophila ananassae]RLT62023.1 putative membrane protein [Wolbachia endosymbiont of Drosophila ananassae]